MKKKSGTNRITKAAIVLMLMMLVQTGFGQVVGKYTSGAQKKKALRKTYKCAKVGVQKVKHIQGRTKTVKTIAWNRPSNELLVASLTETVPQTVQTTVVPVISSTPVVTTEEKKDSVGEKTFRLLPLPVYFRYDSYRMDIIDLTQIALAVSYVKEGHSITLVGHTDNWGSEQYNEVLSGKRANIIRDMMIELGCNPALIIAKGEGEKYPANSNDHEEGRLNNRRVEFLIALN